MRPEHTVAAYELAIEQGADVIECDLAVTKVSLNMGVGRGVTWTVSPIGISLVIIFLEAMLS